MIIPIISYESSFQSAYGVVISIMIKHG